MRSPVTRQQVNWVAYQKRKEVGVSLGRLGFAGAWRELWGEKFIGEHHFSCFLLAGFNGCSLLMSQSHRGKKNKKKPFSAAIDNLSLHEAGST